MGDREPLGRKDLTLGIQDGGTKYLTSSVRARAITVPAVVDEAAVTLGEEGIAFLNVHAVVAVFWLVNGRERSI